MRHLLLLPMLIAITQIVIAQPAPARNIVFLLADDLRWDALGCMGDANAKTPNIDALASRGVLFRNHFVTTSICAVSRASIFSGQHARRHGIDDFATDFTPEAWAQTYPALLRKAGYHTGFIGKFGVGNHLPADAFDFWRGLPGQAYYFKPGDPRHSTATMGEQAIEFLRSVPAGKPLCLSISFKAPHSMDRGPREFPPDPRDEDLFKETIFPVPETATAEYFHTLPPFVQTSEGHKRWTTRFGTPEEYQRNLRDYYRLVHGIDREVGRVIDTLRDLKLDGNTLVIFTSDNGFFYAERQLADKWFMYEESIRVPLIVADPSLAAVRRGVKVDAMSLNIDFAPTILECAGIAIPPAMQGKSLRPLLTGHDAGWRAEFYYEHHTFPKIIPPSEGVRTQRWSYLRWVEPNPLVEELYDVAADPFEKKNLVADPRHAATLEAMRARWKLMRDEVK